MPCSLQLMSRHRSLIATSRCCCRCQLVAPNVATLAQFFCILQLMFMMSRPQSLVATSSYVFGGFTGCFRCRDFSPLSRQQLQWNHLHSSKPVVASRQFTCRDITMLSRHHSLSFWLMLSCLSGDSCHDLLLISFNYLDVATS